MMFNSLYRLILFGSLLILVRTLPTSFGDHVDDGNHQLKESQNGNEISLIKGNEISLPSAIDQFYTELFNADFSTLKRRIGCEKGFTRMKVTRTQKFEIEKDSFLIRRIVWQSKYTACVPDHLVDRVREIQRRHPTDDKQTELSRDLGEKHQLQSVTPELYYSTVINSDMAKEIDPSHGDYPVAVPTLFDLEVEQLDSQLANSFEDVNDAPGVIHSSLQRNQRNRRAPSDKRSARSPTARDRGRTSRPDQRRPKRRLDERRPGRKPNRPHERHPDRQPHHRDHRRRRHHRDHRHPRHHRRHPHSHGRDWWRLRHGRDWRRPKWYPSWWQAREPLTGVKSIVPVVPIDVEPVVTPVAVPRVVVAPTTDVDVVVKPGESELAESDVHSSQLVVDQIVAAPQPLSNSHSENHLRRWIPSPTREQLDANIIDHLSITPHESYQPAPPIPFKEGRISKFSSVSSLVNSHDPSEVSSILQSPRRAPPIDTRLRRPPRTPTPARREDSSSSSPWRRGRQPHRRPLPDSSRRRPLPNDTRRRPGRRPLPSPSRRRGPWGPGRPRPFPRPGPFPFPPFGPQPFRPYPQPRPRPIPVVPFEPYPDDSEVDVGPDVIVQPVNPVVIVPVEPLGQEKEAPIATPVNNGLIEAISDQMSNVTTKL